MSRDQDMQTVLDFLGRQTLDKDEQQFVKDRIHKGLLDREVLSWADLPAPAFSKPSPKGVNQYTFKVWTLPKGEKDFPWKVPYIKREGWKLAQHGCYLELVGETGVPRNPLNNKLFWGVKVSGGERDTADLRRDVSQSVRGLVDHPSKAQFTNDLVSGIGISGTWYFFGYLARAPELETYSGLDELLDDIAGGLTTIYRAFDVYNEQVRERRG